MNKLLVISVLVGALAGCDQVNKVVQGECLGTCYWKIYVQHTYTNKEYIAANFGSAAIYTARKDCMSVIRAQMEAFQIRADKDGDKTRLVTVPDGLMTTLLDASIDGQHPLDTVGRFVMLTCEKIPPSSQY
jgi:hypothetical protein